MQPLRLCTVQYCFLSATSQVDKICTLLLKLLRLIGCNAYLLQPLELTKVEMLSSRNLLSWQKLKFFLLETSWVDKSWNAFFSQPFELTRGVMLFPRYLMLCSRNLYVYNVQRFHFATFYADEVKCFLIVTLNFLSPLTLLHFD